MTAQQIEVALASHFDYRANVIVPNINYSLGIYHEADLIILRPSGFAEEIEIKVSLSDLRADKKKKHGHLSNMIRRLWFAMSVDLCVRGIADVPEHAGIISVSAEYRSKTKMSVIKHAQPGRGWVEDDTGVSGISILRQAKLNPNALKWTSEQREKLLHLGCMRIWALKRKLDEERMKQCQR